VIISREERARELGALRAIDASRARRELAWISAIVASWLVVSLVLMLAG
jgi:type IV secretory pathway component VirB8